MDSPYRVSYPCDEKKDTERKFEYYEMSEVDVCPVCSRKLQTNISEYALIPKWRSDGKYCSQSKRRTVRGFWPFRTKCPLPGVHVHYKCWNCGAVSVLFIEDGSKLKSTPLEQHE